MYEIHAIYLNLYRHKIIRIRAYTCLIRAYTCQYVHDGPKTPVQTGSYFCTYCTYLYVYTCLYVRIRALMCKNMTPFEQGGFRAVVNIKVHIGTYHSGIFLHILCNSYVVVRIEKNTTKIHSRHICMYFDGSRGSFQRLLVWGTQRQYVLKRTSTYYVYVEYGLHTTSTHIYNHMCVHVCLRVTMSVYERSRTTFMYVSIHSNMQICLTMYHYDVLCTTCIYVLIWQFFYIYVQYTYSITHIYVPIRVYTCYTYIRTGM